MRMLFLRDTKVLQEREERVKVLINLHVQVLK